MAKHLLIYIAAALAEIGGCYAFWMWARLGRQSWWLGIGIVLLALFAWLLTRVEVEAAGRAYAVYGGIYIVMSLVWMAAVDGVRPDRWDLAGALLCFVGASLIFAGPGRA